MAFDPTVLGDVIRAGYDRSFDELDERTRSDQPAERVRQGLHRHRRQRDRRSRFLPASASIPGGIGKGLAADLVADEVMAAGAAGVCINLGGDLRVRGRVTGGRTWTVAIEHQLAVEPVVLVALTEGAVATSTTLRRRWTIDGKDRHHLIDPWTGEPSESDLTLVSVVAGEAWIGGGAGQGRAAPRLGARVFDLVGGTGAEAIAVTVAGNLLATDGFRKFVGPSGRSRPHRARDSGGSSVNDKVWWYATRSAGIVAWVLLALSVLWGLALSTKVFGKRPRPNWLLDLHRFLGGLAVVFTAVHVVAIVFDSFVSFSSRQRPRPLHG